MPRRKLFSALLLMLVLFGLSLVGHADNDQDAGLPAAEPGPVMLEFSGPIDGSERIEITRSGAIWLNVDRHLPTGAMTVNGVNWNPRQQATLPNEGRTQFLKQEVDFSRARLEVIEARDTVAMTKSDDGVLLHISDTPNGEGEYRFRIVFDRPRPATLRIRAIIDGSDVLRLSQDEAHWEHKHWDPPRNVSINGHDWDVTAQPVVSNAGETAFLPADVDFSTARVINKSGRDLAVAIPDDDGLTIHFADNPNGTDEYELLIAFGR